MMLYLRFHSPVSMGLAYQAKNGRKRSSSRLMRLSYLKKFRSRLTSHRRRKIYLEEKFAQKLSFSSLNSLNRWNLRKMAQMFSTREQVVTRSVAPDRSHGNHAILLHKLSTKTENPKSMDQCLGIESDYIRPNHEIWVPQTSIEWTIMETSMEDGLMGRAAVSTDRSEKRTEGTEDELSIKQDVSGCKVSDMSASRDEAPIQVFPEKVVRPEPSKEPSNCGNHLSFCRQCISSRIENTFSSNVTVLSSSVDDHAKIERLRTSIERLDEKSVTVSNENVDAEDRMPSKTTDVTVSVIKEVMKLRRRSDSFPPPLASLARKSHAHFLTQLTPVQLHPIRGNGRILLHEVKAPPQPLFQPIRTQGRLVLQLIRYDDEIPQVTLETKEGIPVEEFTANTQTDVLSTESKERPFQNVIHVTNPSIVLASRIKQASALPSSDDPETFEQKAKMCFSNNIDSNPYIPSSH